MLLHEIGVHYGLEGMLGTTNYKRVVKQIKQKHLTDKELKASWDNTLQTYPELTEGSDNFMQEVIANIGETAPNNSIWRQITGYIRQFLSKLGYGWNVNNITADDIRDMVQHSVRMSLAGKVKGAQPDITLAGTGTKPMFFSQLKKELLAHPEKLKVMPAEQWRLWLNKRGKRTIKEEEIVYSKIREFLDSKQPKDSVSREELVNLVETNIPKVETVQLGGALSADSEVLLNQKALERQIGIDNFRIAYDKLRQKLIELVPNAKYKDIVTELPEGWTVRESTDELSGGFDVVTPEGQRMASGDTAQEAITWAIADVLNPRRMREAGGRFEIIGPKDGVDIDKLVERVRQDAQDEAQEADPDNTPDYDERMESVNIANQFAPLELDEFWGAHYAMRKSQDDFNRAIENETKEEARFTRFSLPGDRKGEVNLALVFDNNNNLLYMAPQVHTMGKKADTNRIVHILGNIRTSINGDKVFFVEEIQSDWGQEAYDIRQAAIDNLIRLGFSAEEAKKATPTDYGFKKELSTAEKNRIASLKESLERNREERANLDNYMDRLIVGREALMEANAGKPMDAELNKRLKESVNISEKARKQRLALLEEAQKIRDELDKLVTEDYEKLNRGPYVANTKAWVTLALKQIFRYAADQGLNKVVFANGQQVADRYRLSQIVDTIKWSRAGREENVYTVEGYKNGEKIWSSYHASPENIVDHLGQPVLNEIRIEEYKLNSDPIRKRLVELQRNHLKLRYDAKQSREDIVQHAVKNGWSSQDIDSLLDAIEPLSTADQKGYLVSNLLGAGIQDQDFGKKAINYFIKSNNDYDKAYALYNKEMKLHGLEDALNPIASSIDVPAMEINKQGKGMKEFYNNIVPQAIRDYIKKIGGGEINKTSLVVAPEDTQLEVTLSPKAMETVSGPQPLFARASKQQLEDDLNKSGTKAKEKAPEPTTWDRFKEAPIKTIDEIIADFRKNFFSFDAAINNKILIAMRQQGISEKEVAKSFYEMRVSQAVKADQLADMWMVHGDISYDPNSLSFVIGDVKDSMSTIRNQLKILATKYGVSEYEMYQYGNAAFVAQRSQGLNESNKVLKKKVLKLLVQGKKTQANTTMERGFKLVHLTPAEIRHGLNFFKTIPELNKVYKIWNKNRRRLLAFAEQNGLYDSEEAQDLLDVIDYVPFFRDKQIEAGKGPKTYTRGLLDAAVDKRLKGSYQPVNNVFDNMERWAKYILKKSINNKAAQEKIKFYSKYIPDDIKILRGKERKDTGNIVNIWQNGNLVKYEFQGYDGESMVDGFTGLEPINGLVVPQFLNKYAAFQRAQIVLEPLFNFAQITMDAFDALISSGVNYPVLLPLQVVKEVVLMPFGASKARAYLKQRGIVGKYDWASEYDNIDIQGMKQLKELKTSDKMIKAILSPATVSIKGLKFLGMLSDNLIRQAVWSQIMLETKDAARATFVADEIINFRRTGSNAYVSAARQMAPFVNANLQSANIAFGTMLLSGITPDTKLTQFRRLITSGAQVTAAVLLLTALNADDDDYKKLDPKDRDRLLIIPGSGGYALPVRGSIIAAIYKITPEHLYNRYIEESEDSEKLKKGLTEAFKRAIALPTGFPTLLTPILELSLNLDTVTGLPLRGQSQKDLEADLQYSNKYTSQLARWANDATGVSPIVVQNFMNRWLASTSMLISMFTNKLIADIRGEILPEKTFKEKFLQLPSANKFVTKQQNTRNINDYYELNEIVTAIVNSANKYKDIDYDKFAEYQAKDNNAAIIDMRSELATISRDLTNLRNWENKIYSSKDTGQWTPQTKKQELDRIEQLRQDILGHQQAVEDRLERRIQNLRRQAGL
jgi:hypothetical protein